MRPNRRCARCAISTTISAEESGAASASSTPSARPMDWRAKTYLAIDQGPIVVMIENYRSGLMWRLFMARSGRAARACAVGLQVAADRRLTCGRGAFEDDRRRAGCAPICACPPKAMLSAVSATDLVKERRGFGRSMRPGEGIGSRLARRSPPMIPIPIISFTGCAIRPSSSMRWASSSTAARSPNAKASPFSGIFSSFSLALCSLDGSRLSRQAPAISSERSSRISAIRAARREFRAIAGDNVLGEPRFDPDGSLDILKWSRPQHDGPALRALARAAFCSSIDVRDLDALVAGQANLRCAISTLRWRAGGSPPSISGRRSSDATIIRSSCNARRCGRAALARRAARRRARGLRRRGADERRAAVAGFLERSARLHAAAASAPDARREGARHRHAARGDPCRAPRRPHSVRDPKVVATAARLEDLFASLYKSIMPPRRRARRRWAATPADRYYSGGAYYFSTLGAAEFYFRAAAASAGDGRGAGASVR